MRLHFGGEQNIADMDDIEMDEGVIEGEMLGTPAAVVASDDDYSQMDSDSDMEEYDSVDNVATPTDSLVDKDAVAIDLMKSLLALDECGNCDPANFSHVLLRFRLHLTSKHVPLSVVQFAFDALKVVCNGLLARLKSKAPNPPALKSIEAAEFQIDAAFSSISSHYKMQNHLVKSGKLVAPKPVFLGPRTDRLPDPLTGRVHSVNAVNDFQYISIAETLQQVLSLPAVWKEIEAEQRLREVRAASGDEYLRDFADGLCYKNNCFFSGVIGGLQLLLFYDEFEVANPLGTRAGDHKIGGIYWVIQNLPPSLRSKLSQVFLAVLFYSVDLKTYGFEPILKPLVAELTKLETEGIKVRVKSDSGPPEERTVKASVSQICGDNLGMNQIFNMVASFVNTNFCRFCRVHYDYIGEPECFREVPDLLRTVETYEDNVAAQALNRATNNSEGIKGPCSLNEIPSFHITKNYTASIMHDMWHGVAKYVVLAVCDTLISNKCITEDELNSAVEHFDYGHGEAKNKPTQFTRKEGKLKLKVTFAECAAICRLLPQIVGGRIPREKMGIAASGWDVLIRFLDCSSIIFATACSQAMVDRLGVLVERFLRTFIAHFPDRKVKPKMHFMVHYPRLIQQIGPLGKCSEIRFEANHQPMKLYGGMVHNFRNIAKTVAGRHQLQQSSLWFDGAPFEKNASGLSKEKTVAMSLTEDADILRNIMEDNAVVRTCSAVDYRGVEYRPFKVLVCGINQENKLPVFKQILRIYVPTASCVVFVCRRLITKHFNRHVYAYPVETTEERELVCTHLDQFEYSPVALRRIADGDSYISLRHDPEGVYGL